MMLNTLSRQLADIQVPIDNPGYGGQASPFTDIGNLVTTLYTTALVIIALFSFFYLIFGAFQYITGGGDKAHMQAARERITYAVLGLAIAAAAAAIFSVLGAVFGINIFGKIKFPTP